MRFLFLLLSLSLCAAERLELKRPDGSTLIAYLALPPATKECPLLVVVQGAQSESVRLLVDKLKENATWGILAIEKRGVSETIDAEEFARHHCLEERFQDHQLLLRKLKEGFIPSWNKKWALLGQGEGGKIGAALAARAPDLSALILLAPGGGWDPSKELLQSFRKELISESFTPHYIHSFLGQAKQLLESAQEDPAWDKECFGFTHLYWASLLKADLAQDLMTAQCPIYYVHGDLDDRIPLSSVEALVQKLKTKPQFTCQRKEGMGREVIRDPQIYQEAFDWLKGK